MIFSWKFQGEIIVLFTQLLSVVVQSCSLYNGGVNCSSFQSSLARKSEDDSWILQCPPWFAPDDTTGRCNTGPSLDGLIQQDLSLLMTCLMPCNCMTEEDGKLIVGACLHKCLALQYTPLPCDVHELLDWSCPTHLNRGGVLCSQCIEGYAIPAYSYTLECVRCEHYKYNWLKYLAAAYIPLTALYIGVSIFTINFASPEFSGAIMFFQMVGNPTVIQFTLTFVMSTLPGLVQLMRVAFSFASFWNLDFFRVYYTFCLHPNSSAELIMALDFGKAVFPVILIGVTVALVKLHDKNYNIVVWGWKLIHRIRKFVKRDTKTSLIEVFATFVYLLSGRLFLTSIYFLLPFASYTYYKHSDGSMVLKKEYHLLFAPSVKFFGKKHIPYAIIAFIISTIFYTTPMLLQFFYPFSWFQKILNKYNCNFIFLRIFMDVFQGGYKDGTNGTKDYRYFSGFTLLLPVMLYVTYAITKTVFMIPIICIGIVLSLSSHIIFQPFKNSKHNIIMAVMLCASLGTVLSTNILIGNEHIFITGVTLFIISFSVPFLYLFFTLFVKVLHA